VNLGLAKVYSYLLLFLPMALGPSSMEDTHP